MGIEDTGKEQVILEDFGVAAPVVMRTNFYKTNIEYTVEVNGRVTWSGAIPFKKPYAQRVQLAREQERLAEQAVREHCAHGQTV